MTNLHELYDIFLSNITDYRILSMIKEDMEKDTKVVQDILFGYFKSARAKFYRCKKNLKTNVEKTMILDELDDFEIEILVNLMLVAHITPQLISSENLKQSLSDKDFKIYSQANQLREVRLLLNSYKSITKKMITEYTFFDLGEDDLK